MKVTFSHLLFMGLISLVSAAVQADGRRATTFFVTVSAVDSLKYGNNVLASSTITLRSTLDCGRSMNPRSMIDLQPGGSVQSLDDVDLCEIPLKQIERAEVYHQHRKGWLTRNWQDFSGNAYENLYGGSKTTAKYCGGTGFGVTGRLYGADVKTLLLSLSPSIPNADYERLVNQPGLVPPVKRGGYAGAGFAGYNIRSLGNCSGDTDFVVATESPKFEDSTIRLKIHFRQLMTSEY